MLAQADAAAIDHTAISRARAEEDALQAQLAASLAAELEYPSAVRLLSEASLADEERVADAMALGCGSQLARDAVKASRAERAVWTTAAAANAAAAPGGFVELADDLPVVTGEGRGVELLEMGGWSTLPPTYRSRLGMDATPVYGAATGTLPDVCNITVRVTNVQYAALMVGVVPADKDITSPNALCGPDTWLMDSNLGDGQRDRALSGREYADCDQDANITLRLDAGAGTLDFLVDGKKDWDVPCFTNVRGPVKLFVQLSTEGSAVRLLSETSLADEERVAEAELTAVVLPELRKRHAKLSAEVEQLERSIAAAGQQQARHQARATLLRGRLLWMRFEALRCRAEEQMRIAAAAAPGGGAEVVRRSELLAAKIAAKKLAVREAPLCNDDGIPTGFSKQMHSLPKDVGELEALHAAELACLARFDRAADGDDATFATLTARKEYLACVARAIGAREAAVTLPAAMSDLATCCTVAAAAAAAAAAAPAAAADNYERPAVADGAYGRVKLDLYGMSFKVHRSAADADPKQLEISIPKSASMAELKLMACKAFDIDPKSCQLWDWFNNKPYADLEPSLKAEDSLKNAKLIEDQDLYLNERDGADGEYPKLKADNGYSGGSEAELRAELARDREEAESTWRACRVDAELRKRSEDLRGEQLRAERERKAEAAFQALIAEEEEEGGGAGGAQASSKSQKKKAKQKAKKAAQKAAAEHAAAEQAAAARGKAEASEAKNAARRKAEADAVQAAAQAEAVERAAAEEQWKVAAEAAEAWAATQLAKAQAATAADAAAAQAAATEAAIEAADAAAAIEAAEQFEVAARVAEVDALMTRRAQVAAAAAAAQGGAGAGEQQRRLQLDENALVDRLALLQGRGLEGSLEYAQLMKMWAAAAPAHGGSGADETKDAGPVPFAPAAPHGGCYGGGGGATAALPPLPRPASPVGAPPRSPLFLLLRQHGLQQHAAVLEENGVTLADVGGLTSDELREVGIAKLMDRKGLLNVFRAHAEGAAGGGGSGAAAAAPTLRAQLAEMEIEKQREKERTSEALSCAVCMEVFELPPGARTPKTLPCMHSFCERCLLAHARGAASIECPTCREATQLPERGVAGLKTTFALLGMLETFMDS
jgi:hypothetical protein